MPQEGTLSTRWVLGVGPVGGAGLWKRPRGSSRMKQAMQHNLAALLRAQREAAHGIGVEDEARIVLRVANLAPWGRCRGTALCGLQDYQPRTAVLYSRDSASMQAPHTPARRGSQEAKLARSTTVSNWMHAAKPECTQKSCTAARRCIRAGTRGALDRRLRSKTLDSWARPRHS